MHGQARTFLKHHWFLLALTAMLVLGFGASRQLQILAKLPGLSHGLVALTMFLMSWPLRFADLRYNLQRPAPAILASFINLLWIPLAAWPCSWLLGGELGAGLIILAATPCTLASASVWTRRAGGNDIISMLVTIVTNGSCFLVTPFWIWLLAGRAVPGELLGSMIVTLLGVVVLPLVAAQITRGFPPIAIRATQYKHALSVAAQIGLLGVVLIGCVQSGVRLRDQPQAWQWTEFAWMLPVLAGLHLGAWGYGFWQSLRLGFSRADSIAVSFSGSQKTLMVGVVAAIRLDFSVIPLIAYHVLQLLIDTYLADRLRAGAGSVSESRR